MSDECALRRRYARHAARRMPRYVSAPFRARRGAALCGAARSAGPHRLNFAVAPAAAARPIHPDTFLRKR
ncbi:hypothetical protein C2U71_29095 [Burkholderia ubonensis]|nr:hypothetical protein C2U71_29095 [Burkholderia ubonensis]